MLIPERDYAFAASITPTSDAVSDRDNVLLARATARNTYYFAGIGYSKATLYRYLQMSPSDEPANS